MKKTSLTLELARIFNLCLSLIQKESFQMVQIYIRSRLGGPISHKMFVKIALFQAGCTPVCESHFSQAVIYAGPPHAKTTIHEKTKNPQNQNPSSHPPSAMSTPQTTPLLGPWVIDPPLFGLGQRFRRRAGCHCRLFHPSRCCRHRRGTAAPEAGVGGSTAPSCGLVSSAPQPPQSSTSTSSQLRPQFSHVQRRRIHSSQGLGRSHHDRRCPICWLQARCHRGSSLPHLSRCCSYRFGGREVEEGLRNGTNVEERRREERGQGECGVMRELDFLKR